VWLDFVESTRIRFNLTFCNQIFNRNVNIALSPSGSDYGLKLDYD